MRLLSAVTRGPGAAKISGLITRRRRLHHIRNLIVEDRSLTAKQAAPTFGSARGRNRFATDSPLEQERFEPPVPLPDLGRSGAFEICSILVLVEAYLLVAINSGTNVGAHGCTDEH
jgi:hypothetical protein